jgi:hypothetical protein
VKNKILWSIVATLAIGSGGAIICDSLATSKASSELVNVSGDYIGWWGSKQNEQLLNVAKSSAYTGALVGAAAAGLIVGIVWMLNDGRDRSSGGFPRSYDKKIRDRKSAESSSAD